MTFFKDLPVFLFSTSTEWREWLDDYHDSVSAVWIKLAKKGSTVKTLTYEEARDIAIAYGWIDGLINRWDENIYLTRFTPRKPKSVWSKTNCGIAEALIESGAMHPAGIKQVELAKKDGRWDRAYEGSSTINVPNDFQEALDSSPKAGQTFASLNAANRYAFLWRIQTAGTAATRSNSIARFIAMLENDEVFHPRV